MPSDVSVAFALDRIIDQPRAKDLLAAAVREDRLSHAYLFVGAPGSGMADAAEALAMCAICADGGDGSCDECIRVAHRTHPDVRWLAPGSVTGYLVDQVRDVIADASLSPARATRKVYIVERAELLRGAAANALLKTIEEPPSDVIFVLMARAEETVLPTIVSRCQVVRFQVIAPDVALAELVRSGATEREARIALSVAGTPMRATEFLSSASRRQVRRIVVRIMGELARDDSWDVLQSARELLDAVRVPLAGMKDAQEAALKESSDFLTSTALKQVEAANRRELSARERSGMMEVLATIDSILRDVLLRCEDVAEPIVNVDAADVIDRLAAATSAQGALKALGASSHAADDLEHNVSSQLTLEVMLFSIKEALACPPSFR